MNKIIFDPITGRVLVTIYTSDDSVITDQNNPALVITDTKLLHALDGDSRKHHVTRVNGKWEVAVNPNPPSDDGMPERKQRGNTNGNQTGH